jgi:hypothetical protein
MADHNSLFFMRMVQNIYKNSIKTGEVGTKFALSLSLSLSHINKCIVVFNHTHFHKARPGFSVWGIPAFLFIAGLCL